MIESGTIAKESGAILIESGTIAKESGTILIESGTIAKESGTGDRRKRGALFPGCFEREECR